MIFAMELFEALLNIMSFTPASVSGLVVKAVDEAVNRKRKADKMSGVNSPGSVKTSASSGGTDPGYQLGMLPPDLPGAATPSVSVQSASALIWSR